jgi:hypothetical protein
MAASPPNLLCPVCGKGRLQTHVCIDRFEYEGPNGKIEIYAQNMPIEACGVCGENFFGPKALSIKNDAIRQALSEGKWVWGAKANFQPPPLAMLDKNDVMPTGQLAEHVAKLEAEIKNLLADQLDVELRLRVLEEATNKLGVTHD